MDLLNEAFESLYSTSQSGKSLDSFISQKNSLNRRHCDIDRDIPRHVFYKAFEIFIFSLNYDAKVAFHCLDCPEPLDKNESEEDYPEVCEVHITDGVDMGCQENNIKGIVPDDIFKLQRSSEELIIGIDCSEGSKSLKIKRTKSF